MAHPLPWRYRSLRRPGTAGVIGRDAPARAPIYDIRDFAAFGRSLYRHMPLPAEADTGTPDPMPGAGGFAARLAQLTAPKTATPAQGPHAPL